MSSKNEMSTDTNGTLRVFLCQSVKGSGSEARFSDPTQIEISEFDPAAFDKQAESALIIFADPIVQLCTYITQGLTYSEALNRWIGEARDLLALQRGNRRQILLVDDRYFATAPTAGLKVLEARLGVSLGGPVTYQAPEPDPLLRVLVTHGVNTNELVSALISELGAVSLGSDPMPLDIDQAFLFHQETQARLKDRLAEHESQKGAQATYTAHIVELQPELEKTQDVALNFHRQQIIELQRELGLAIRRENELDERLQATTQERDLYVQKLQVAQDAVLEARHVYEAAEGRRSQTFEELSQTGQRAMLQFQQIKRLHTQLQNAKAEASENSAMIEQMRQERATLAERISWLESDRLKILSSGSWAVTKPLRSVNKILGGSAKKKD